MASRHTAALLADNLATVMERRHTSAEHVEHLARLDSGLVPRILAGDPAAFPCPMKMHRLALALGTTTTQLLSDDL